MDKVTGQVFLREHGEAPTHDGRTLVSIAGNIAVPKDWPFKGEHQYVLTGGSDGLLCLDPSTGLDLTEEARGNTVGGMLTQPIWRC